MRPNHSDLMHPEVLSQEEELHWLALKLVPELARAFQRGSSIDTVVRREYSGPLERNVRAPASAVPSRSQSSAAAFSKMPPRNHKKVKESGAVLVTIGDPRYPFSLREIYDPPVLLFAHGRLELVESIMLGVIGTSRPTG